VQKTAAQFGNGLNPDCALLRKRQGGQRDKAIVQNLTIRGKDLSFPTKRTGPVKGKAETLSTNEATWTTDLLSCTINSVTKNDMRDALNQLWAAGCADYAAMSIGDTTSYMDQWIREIRSSRMEKKTYAAAVASSSDNSDAMRPTSRTSAALSPPKSNGTNNVTETVNDNGAPSAKRYGKTLSPKSAPKKIDPKHFGKPRTKAYSKIAFRKAAPKRYEPKFPSVTLWLQRQALTPWVEAPAPSSTAFLEPPLVGEKTDDASVIKFDQPVTKANPPMMKEDRVLSLRSLDENLAQIKYLGGMKSASTPSRPAPQTQPADPSPFAGLKLTNQFSVDCFLNSAVNTIVSNKVLMNELNSASADWHTNSKATAVAEELKRLANGATQVQNVRTLKAVLHQHIPRRVVYGTNEQEDAHTPFMDIVDCFPSMQAHLNISIETVRKCSECGRESVLSDSDSNRMIPLTHFGRKPAKLQDKVDEWCHERAEVEHRCQCKTTPLHFDLEHDKDIPDTVQVITKRVITAPKVLCIGTRMDRAQAVPITVSQTVTVNAVRYGLKSAMLYTGDTNSGHWRSLIKEGEHFVLYDDASVPRQIGTSQLTSLLTKATNLIYLPEHEGPVEAHVDVSRPQTPSTAGIASCTPVKRATASGTQQPKPKSVPATPCTPLKRMSLSSPAAKAARRLDFASVPDKQAFVAPSQPTSVTQPPVASVAHSPLTPSKRSKVQRLEMPTIEDKIHASGQAIVILYIDTDLKQKHKPSEGNVEYMIRQQVFIYYRHLNDTASTTKCIRLGNMLRQGFRKLRANVAEPSQQNTATPQKKKPPF